MIKLKNILAESFRFNTPNLNEQDTAEPKNFYIMTVTPSKMDPKTPHISTFSEPSIERVIDSLNMLYRITFHKKGERYNISDMSTRDTNGDYIIDDFALVTDNKNRFELAKTMDAKSIFKPAKNKVSIVNKDNDINNNGYPDNSETGNTFRRVYSHEIDADDEDASWEIFDWCDNPYDTMMSRWEPKGWPKLPNGKSYYTATDAGDKYYNFHFDANPQVVLYNNQLYAGVSVSEAYAHEFQGRGLIAKWLENAIPDIVKHYQACSYVKKNYPEMIIKPCLQVDGDESGGAWEKLCRKNGWILFDF